MIDGWSIAGRYFGYPECCIQSFTELNHLKDPEQRQFKAANSTGFVPCSCCAEKVLSGECQLKDLITAGRKAERKFPRDTKRDSQVIDHLIQLEYLKEDVSA